MTNINFNLNTTASEEQTNKEERTMNTFNGEVINLETGHIERAFIVDQGHEYLIKPYMLESSEDGEISHRHYASYVLSKELEGFEYNLYLQEEEETKMKMDLQLFANKVEEEVEMLKQIEMFNDIAKTIEEIDEAGGDVYVGGVKVSWESVKQFIYGLDDEELKLLAYSNKPAIPAELEVFAIYLLEAEKAWDNESTMQNYYFNSKKNISMDLQFFAKGGAKEKKVLEGHTLALSHIEILEKQRENLLSFLEGRKVDELTSDIQQELYNLDLSIKRWSSIHNESLRYRAKEGAIKLGRGY